MLTVDDERLSREAEWHIRRDGLIEAIATTVLFIIFAIGAGYLSWIDEGNRGFNIILFGLCVGISLISIQMFLKKEIKKELKRRKEKELNQEREKLNLVGS